MSVIVIEPLALLRCEHLDKDGTKVVGAERDIFETQEMTEIGSLGGDGKEDILNAYAKLSWDIDAWFVRDVLSGVEGKGSAGSQVFTNLNRSFMDTEAVTDAMTRSVTKVVAFTPHCHTGGGVELQTCRAIGEVQMSQLQVTF